MSRRLLLLCFATLPAWGAESRSVEPSGGFVAVPPAEAQHAGATPGLAWVCNRQGDESTGVVRVPTETDDTLALSVSGSFDGDHLRLSLQTLDGQRELKLGLRSAPGPVWVTYRWDLPASWRRIPVLVVAEDDTRHAWLGIAIATDLTPLRRAQWRALGAAVAALAIIVLPFFAAYGLLAPRYRHDAPLHATLALVAAGAYALAVFFAYFFATWLGTTALAIGAVTAGLAAFRCWSQRSQSEIGWTAPLAAIALGTFLVAVTLLYGGVQSPEGVPAQRHELGLPVDNQIPQLFAEKIHRHEPLQPFLLDWLTSDRPPLQTGWMLLSHAVLGSGVSALAAAIGVQLVVYVGLWIFLGILGLDRRMRVVLGLCAVSGFFLLNSLYAWPKLLPAGFLLALAGLLFRLRRKNRPAAPAEIVACGGCAALAMLGHGGSFFALLGLGIVHLASRAGWRDIRFLAGGAAVAFALYAPWIAYQKFADPPGDRLIKFHLADRTAIDTRGALTVIAEAYRQTPIDRILANKRENLRVLVGDPLFIASQGTEAMREAANGRWSAGYRRLAGAIQAGAFFHLFQSLGLLLLGLPALYFARRSHPAWVSAARFCLVLSTVIVVGWCLLMFGGGSTVVHQGSYLVGALLHVAGALGLLALRPAWLRYTLISGHVAIALGVWIFSPEWNAWRAELRPTWEPFWLIVATVSVALAVWTGARLPLPRESP